MTLASDNIYDVKLYFESAMNALILRTQVAGMKIETTAKNEEIFAVYHRVKRTSTFRIKVSAYRLNCP